MNLEPLQSMTALYAGLVLVLVCVCVWILILMVLQSGRGEEDTEYSDRKQESEKPGDFI